MYLLNLSEILSAAEFACDGRALIPDEPESPALEAVSELSSSDSLEESEITLSLSNEATPRFTSSLVFLTSLVKSSWLSVAVVIASEVLCTAEVVSSAVFHPNRSLRMKKLILLLL